MTSTAILKSRLRTVGNCPPSLLVKEDSTKEDAFLQKVALLLQDGLSLRDDATVGEIQECLKLCSGSNEGSITDEAEKASTTAKRAVMLAIIGATSPESSSLKAILDNGLLFTIKSWLDDILTNGLGGVDLLLYLLGNIAMLPVTKEHVTQSKLGKLVAAVEKDKICKGTLNESAIKERVSKVKEEWSASVKRFKKASGGLSKRSLDSEPSSPVAPAAKRSKASEPAKSEAPKKSSLSSYLSKVSASAEKEESAAEEARKRAQERAAKLREKLAKKEEERRLQQIEEQVDHDHAGVDSSYASDNGEQKRRVKWADSFGGPLSISHTVSDHRRDRASEREILNKAKRGKLEDQNDSLDTMVMMYSNSWKQPQLTPTNNPPIDFSSEELNNQMRRVLSTLPANFLSEEDVPSDPTPLTEMEQTLDLASQSATVPQKIPLFVTPEPEPPVAATVHAPLSVPAPAPLQNNFVPAVSAVPPPPPAQSSGATIELLQSLGLPTFLVGQNTSAVQTLAQSPGLLDSFRDPYGNYDQTKILTLVQTLTASLGGAPPAPAAIPPPPPKPAVQQYMQQPVQTYGSVPLQPSTFQIPPPPPTQPVATSFQSQAAQPSNEGNLHLSGYGPMTTKEMIIQLFSPYVRVDEVVVKNNFMFLNTSDPDGASRAKEALTGVMVGGSPLRINPAVRKNKTVSTSTPIPQSAPLPRDALGQIDYSNVKDDRGNPATRNLFVAGYGVGTSEEQLKALFSPFCTVTKIVMKTTFSFVNTAEKKSAIDARQALIGTLVNGGPLRINFAKESGRLGTSFDNSLQNAQRAYAAPQQSYYGNFSGKILLTPSMERIVIG